MKKNKIIFFVALIAVLFFAIFLASKIQRIITMDIKGKKITMIVSNNDLQREKGLGGKESLPQNTGMIFVFDHHDLYGIWMKDMKFSIDILWLDEKCQVIDKKSASPDTYPTAFYPSQKASFVMEFPLGILSDVKIGDTLNCAG